MKVAHIVPTAYISQMPLSKYHLIISCIVLSDDKYAEEYKQKSKDGNFVILDNSTFELGYPQSTEEILTAYDKVQASEIVAPDIIEDSEGTIEKTESFIKEVNKLYGKDLPIMGIPQGKDFESWMKCYRYMLEQPSISSIGLSFLSLNKIYSLDVPPTLWRMNMFYHLKYMNLLKKQIHVLGVSDNPIEIKYLYNGFNNYIRGIDTSSAWIHGTRGHLFSYYDGLFIPKIKTKMNFSEILDNENFAVETKLKTARINMNTMKEWARYE